jgi:hypothetical protein
MKIIIKIISTNLFYEVPLTTKYNEQKNEIITNYHRQYKSTDEIYFHDLLQRSGTQSK